MAPATRSKAEDPRSCSHKPRIVARTRNRKRTTSTFWRTSSTSSIELVSHWTAAETKEDAGSCFVAVSTAWTQPRRTRSTPRTALLRHAWPSSLFGRDANASDKASRSVDRNDDSAAAKTIGSELGSEKLSCSSQCARNDLPRHFSTQMLILARSPHILTTCSSGFFIPRLELSDRSEGRDMRDAGGVDDLGVEGPREVEAVIYDKALSIMSLLFSYVRQNGAMQVKRPCVPHPSSKTDPEIHESQPSLSVEPFAPLLFSLRDGRLRPPHKPGNDLLSFLESSRLIAL
jgi:hypothetical protein